MSSKLDLLAQKEQQLRLLNDQLDKKKSNLLAAKIETEEDPEDFQDSQQQRMNDSYEGDDFEQSTHKSKTLKGMALNAADIDDDGDKDDYDAIAEEESKDQYDYGAEMRNQQ